jgi:hypothetical protein
MEIMKFGKHQGLPLADIPVDYLLWCYENMKACPSYVTEELGRRGHKVTDMWLARRGKPTAAQRPHRRFKTGKRGRAEAERQTRKNVAAKVKGLQTAGLPVPYNLMREYHRLCLKAGVNGGLRQPNPLRTPG